MRLCLTDVDQAFLVAARELSLKQKELYSLLAAGLGKDPYDFWVGSVSSAEVGWFRAWQLRRQLQRLQSGRFQCWAWNFQGSNATCRTWTTVGSFASTLGRPRADSPSRVGAYFNSSSVCGHRGVASIVCARSSQPVDRRTIIRQAITRRCPWSVIDFNG
jgi:hypothetical protein